MKALCKYKLYEGTALRCNKCGFIMTRYCYSLKEGKSLSSLKKGFGTLLKYLCEKCAKELAKKDNLICIDNTRSI